MEKVKSYKQGLLSERARCINCDWKFYSKDNGEKDLRASSSPRYHAAKHGHKVYIYRENGFVVIPQE